MENEFIKRNNPKKLSIAIFSFILLSLMVFMLISCGDSGVYTLDDNGKTVTLQQGDPITLKLESNPTTGYGWSLTDEMDDAVVSLTSTEYKQAKTDGNMVGSGGYEYFYFRSAAPGSTEIVLNYARPWEEGVEPVDVFRLTVVVK